MTHGFTGPEARWSAMSYGPGMSGSSGAFHCPSCGYSGPEWHPGPSPAMGYGGGFTPGYYAMSSGWGLGGLRKWGGTYSPQYVATGLPTDEEITEMVYDAIDADPLIPYDADINVDVDAGMVTLTGTVLNKNVKRAAGDDVWWIPGVTDVRNSLAVTGRRKVKGAPSEGGPSGHKTAAGSMSRQRS